MDRKQQIRFTAFFIINGKAIDNADTSLYRVSVRHLWSNTN